MTPIAKYSMRVTPQETAALTTRMQIGRIIHDARERLGLKQHVLAAQVDLESQGQISSIESGRLIPELKVAIKLERALHLPEFTLSTKVLEYLVEERLADVSRRAQQHHLPFQVHVNFNRR